MNGVIYFIANKKTWRTYLGCTTHDVKARIYLHRSKLKHHKHVTKQMQIDWDTFGPNAFECGVIEYVPNTSAYGLAEIERGYLDCMPKDRLYNNSSPGRIVFATGGGRMNWEFKAIDVPDSCL